MRYLQFQLDIDIDIENQRVILVVGLLEIWGSPTIGRITVRFLYSDILYRLRIKTEFK